MDPNHSKGAMVWATCDMAAILISIILLVVESIPSVGEYFNNKDFTSYYILYAIEVIVNTFFTLDLLLKLATWPGIRFFLKDILNWLDLLAVLPFYIELIMMLSSSTGVSDKFVVLRICRTSRVIRIFKFVRHSQELLLVMKVITGAASEFVLLSLLISIFVLTFGAIIYFLEIGQDSGYDSILMGCWFGIVTVTTVGYGDVYPTSSIGKLVGGLAVLIAIVIMALPMTVIVNKFNRIFAEEKKKQEKEKEDVRKVKAARLKKLIAQTNIWRFKTFKKSKPL